MAVPLGERRLPIYNLIKFLSGVVLCPFFNLQVKGQINIPESGPFLLLPKHQRWEDIPLLSLAITRPLYYIGKYELFRNPMSRLFLSSVGGLPLNRQSPTQSIQSVRRALDLLKSGEGVVVFPEGTYYKNIMGKGHKGLVRMLLSRSSAPLVPVGINYSRGSNRICAKIEIGRSVSTNTSQNINESIDLAFKEIARLSGVFENDNGE